MLNFPSNPADGDLYEGPNGVTYQWNMLKNRWECLSNGEEVETVTSIYVGENAPNSSLIGQGSLWFDSTDGSLYIYLLGDSIGVPSQWIPVISCGPSDPNNLESITDVTYITPPQNGEILGYTGAGWNNISPASAFSISLDSLTDTNLNSPINFNYLSYNGTEWINKNIELNEINGISTTIPSLNEVIIYNGSNYTNSTLSSDNLSDIDTSTVSPISGQILKYNGINFIPGELKNLNEVEDVEYITPLESGEYLRYNGVNWINSGNPVSDLVEAADDTGAAVSGVQIGGLYRTINGTTFGDIRVRLL